MTDQSPDIQLTIEVLYSCHACGLRKIAVRVPARGNEDVVRWLEDVAAPALGADHKRRSFLCRVTSLSEVMIPIGGADRVGDAPRN